MEKYISNMKYIHISLGAQWILDTMVSEWDHFREKTKSHKRLLVAWIYQITLDCV